MPFFKSYEEAMNAAPDEIEGMNQYVDHFTSVIAETRRKGLPLCEAEILFLEDIKAFKATCPKSPWQKFCEWLKK